MSTEPRNDPRSWILWVCLPIAAVMLVLTAIPATIGLFLDIATGKDGCGVAKDWNDSGNPRFPRG